MRDAQQWAFRKGVPLRVELLDLVSKSADELGADAEQERLGFHEEGRLHPDIYMNELLVGMRAIHQVLPAIMRKLGITRERFRFEMPGRNGQRGSSEEEEEQEGVTP